MMVVKKPTPMKSRVDIPLKVRERKWVIRQLPVVVWVRIMVVRQMKLVRRVRRPLPVTVK